MQPKRWIPLALFLGAALLSSMLSPALSSSWRNVRELVSAAFIQPGVAQAGETDGNESLPNPIAQYREPGSGAALAAVVQSAIFLPLWEEDYQAYLPLLQR
jgi:hypothetical protein